MTTRNPGWLQLFFLLRAAWPVALTSFNSWQLLSGAVEFPRALYALQDES
jgi:hypothetical protein